MWKANISKAIAELRFVLKTSPEHIGSWKYASRKLPELRMLNQRTFFSLEDIPNNLKTPSAIHVIYGDVHNTSDAFTTENLTIADIEKILQEKVAHGLTLERRAILNNEDRELPIDIVESESYVRHQHD